MKQFYHGAKQNGPYFEGWYLKCQTANEQSLALIPAVHIDASGKRSASLQVITNQKSWWFGFPAASLQVFEDTLFIALDKNTFTDEGIELSIHQNDLTLDGKIDFGSFTPLKSDIMGPFRFLPDMECAHGVISMKHPIYGQLTLNGETLDFGGGSGYIETDRGCSFPSAYLWTQCFWKAPQSISLMLSIATIPTPIGPFTGCICAICCNRREYRLATYRGARIQHWSDKGAIIRQGKYHLEVNMLEAKAHPLRAPIQGNMERTIHESLCTKVRYRFWISKNLIFDHTDRCASFEFSSECE